MALEQLESVGRMGETERPQRTLAQQRSRDRQTRILDAACALIEAAGSDHLKMSALANEAGISIGSLYQYFLDKAAVIQGLAARYNVETRECVEAAFADVGTPAELATAFSELIRTFYALVRTEPVRRDIWAGMQADKVLMALQQEESRAMGDVLARAALRSHPALDRREAASSAFVLWELGEAAVRTAVCCDDTIGKAVMATYERMALRELESLGDPR